MQDTEPAPPRPTFREVFAAHAEFVLRTVRRMGVREADVEDVSQDVFIVVHRKLDQWDARCQMRSWLFGIVMRVVSDYRKRAHVRRERITDRPPDRPCGEGRVEARAELASLSAALDLLEADHRAVFVLYELEGMPMKAIAEAVGCPLFTAYSRLRTARERVLAQLHPDRREARHGR